MKNNVKINYSRKFGEKTSKRMQQRGSYSGGNLGKRRITEGKTGERWIGEKDCQRENWTVNN